MLLFLSRRFSLKNLRRRESPWEMWFKRIVAGFSPVTAIAIAIAIVVVVASSTSSPPSPGLSVWNRAVWEIGEHRAESVSLFFSFSSLLSSTQCQAASQFISQPTFLSYRQPFSPCRFSRLWMSPLIRTITSSSSPLILFYTTSFSFDCSQLFNANVNG